MRTFVGILLIALGVLAFLGAQRTWKPGRKLVGELDSDSDPVWRLPMKGRLIAVTGMLVSALGLVLLTT